MKKQSFFVNKISKIINNNQKYCDINENIIEETKDSNLKETIDEKLDKIFNTNGYIFNIDVTIITKVKEYHTKIASKINNYIITLDNDIICIDDILDVFVNK